MHIATMIQKHTISAAVALTFLVLFALALIRAFRPTRYIVWADDALYTDYLQNAPLPDPATRIVIVPQREQKNLRASFFGAEQKTAAHLRAHQEIALLPTSRAENEVFYPLAATPLLPAVPADFTAPQSANNSLIAPTLSLTFTAPESLPQGYRALPVESAYADAPDYKLATQSGVLCTVFEPRIADALAEWCQKAFPASEKKTDPAVVTIASVGDIMVARGVQEILIDKEDGVKTVFGDTLPILHDADFTLGNLEGVVTESWSNATKTYTFKFKKAVLPKLQDAGFDYLMQANNHCYDYGESGFKDTLAAFKAYNIPTSGAGKDLDEAKQFYHTTVKGLPISVISCGAFPVERSGFNGEKTATATKERAGILWQSEDLITRIKAEKAAGYFVIVNVHGGEEYHFKPTKKQRELYEKFCDNGADVVFGSHPHVLQPTEWRNNSLIVYSLGNFLFNGMEEMPGGTDSEIVKIGVLNGRITYVEQFPVKIGNSKVSLKK